MKIHVHLAKNDAYQRRPPIGILDIWHGTVLQEQLGNSLLSVARRIVQCRVATAILGIDARSLVDNQCLAFVQALAVARGRNELRVQRG
jgi:hypothetical protein